MLSLAAPVVMAELGWVTMGIVDTIMVGGLGADAIGAVGLASMLFLAVAVFAMGLLLGLDPLVAQAFGAARLDECHRWLVDGVWLCVIVTVPVIAVPARADARRWARGGCRRRCWRLTRPYLDVLTWSLPPLLLYVAFRRYLQGLGIVRPVMVALVAANVVNAVANWMLIYGHLGAPAHGRARIGLGDARSRASSWRRGCVVVVLRTDGDREPRLRDTPFRLDLARLRRLFALGLPAAGQAVLEVGVFAAATALAGARLGRRAGGAPDRAEHGGVHLHGAARPGVGGGGARRPRGRPPGSARRRERRLDGDWHRRRVHGRRGRRVPDSARAADPRVHPRPGRARTSASRCCSSPRSSSCSTACRG